MPAFANHFAATASRDGFEFNREPRISLCEICESFEMSQRAP